MGADPSGDSEPTERGERIALSERIRALERAVSDADDPPTPVPAVTDVATDLDSIAERVETLEASVEELDARQQAVEAYVDRVEHVNDTIERRADAALAAVDRFESATTMEHPAPPEREATGPTQHSEHPRQDAVDEQADSHPPHRSADAATAHVADAASGIRGRGGGQSDSGAEPRSTEQGLFARLLGR